jgi:hypothetical protein
MVFEIFIANKIPIKKQPVEIVAASEIQYNF